VTDRHELIQKVRLGEDSFLELKAVHFAGAKVRGPKQDVVADELAAFANGAGGTLLLGVEDQPREIRGIPVERLDDVERVVQQACEQSVTPPIAPIIERLTLPDAAGVERPVLRVVVARSLFVHESPGGYLLRVGSSKRRMSPDQLARLFQQRSQSRLIRFDETPVSASAMSDLDPALWRRFARGDSADPDEVLLRKLAMAAKDPQGVWRPTVAGVLMATHDPARFIPTAYVQAVAYRGTSVVPDGESLYQIDAQDLTGPLDRQILGACAFVWKNMKVAAYKGAAGGRVDVPEYSMRAVFEAVVNAVAHRDYSMPGSKVRMRLFRDRLEIYSPGMLPNSMTTGDLAFRQSARNEAVASLLARCALPENPYELRRQFVMDRRGEGVPVILTESEALSGVRPEYRLLGESELLLTLFAANRHVSTDR
jgi:predicted HTH transcriptional regulator